MAIFVGSKIIDRQYYRCAYGIVVWNRYWNQQIGHVGFFVIQNMSNWLV